MSSPDSSAPSSPPRRVRVRKADTPASAAQRPAAGSSGGLATDSLGWSLLLAARVLAQVHGGKSLAEALSFLAGEPAAARAAAQDVAYGVLRRYGWADFILARLMQKPLTHAETQALLHGALYRLETRPEAAPMVVDQAVAACGELAGGVFKGLVNGVLRNYLRQRDALLAATAGDDVVCHQHPAWWLARLRRVYPGEWTQIVAAGNGQPPMALRVNRRRGSVGDYMDRLAAAGIAARALGACGVLLDQPVAVDALPGFFDGDVSVQDIGAQRAAELLSPAAGARVLDACAAPGGKTAHLLESVDLDLTALDVDALRTRRIEDNLRRLHLAATLRVADCRALDAWWDGRAFDAILADVPCSASGVVRRHPDIKHLRRASDIRNFAHTQAAIIDALWRVLKPGGKLLYATCSVFAEENAAQVESFVVRQPDAACEFQQQLLPAPEHDGFFYALLHKAV